MDRIDTTVGAQRDDEEEAPLLGHFDTADPLRSLLLTAMMDVHRLRGVSVTDSSGNSIGEYTIQDLLSIMNPAQRRQTMGEGEVDDDDDDPDYVDVDEEDEDGQGDDFEEDEEQDYYLPTPTHDRDLGGWYPKVTEPQDQGLALLMGGEFGRIRHQVKSRAGNNNVARILLNRRSAARPPCHEDIAADILPNSGGTAVAAYNANAYVGQFSSDFKLHIYNTAAPFKTTNSRPRMNAPGEDEDGHRTSMEIIKTVRAAPGRWTITDSHLSPDNQRMIYASVTDTVHMCSTLDSDPVQHPIYFGDAVRGRRHLLEDWYDDEYSIWSCKFSADGNEVIAGGSRHLFVYDLVADRRTVKIRGHADDINSCCWADTASGNVLISASDDSFVKVWDRRSLAGTQKPSGVLIGHTEGITYVSAKGDGRYVVSNGKDQVLRLWDLRKMRSNLEFEQCKGRKYGIDGYDYRGDGYPRPRHRSHPLDCSVMQYTGHDVLRTLIRCHFSPAETTGQQYIYSGSANGKIHIWSLDGRIVQVLDRQHTLSMAFDPTGPEHEKTSGFPVRPCVRDVSWHSEQPVLMSTGWLGRRWGHHEGSVIARHEWKGLSKSPGAVEDWVERRRLESMERGQRPPRQHMPGSFSTSDDSD